MIKDDQLVTLAAFGRHVPGSKRRAVVRLNREIFPVFNSVVIGILKDKAARRLHERGECFDLVVVFSGDALLLIERSFHSFF